MSCFIVSAHGRKLTFGFTDVFGNNVQLDGGVFRPLTLDHKLGKCREGSLVGSVVQLVK